MIKSVRTMGIATAVLALLAGTAVAQQKATDQTPAATTTTKAAKTKMAKSTKTAAAPSPCKGLDQNACSANSICTWYKEITTKKGQKRKAHCQKKPTPPSTKAKSTK